ncbi:MAG: HAMP domain-containing sensor histidine kinase [Lachnospiraceae bacterium]
MFKNLSLRLRLTILSVLLLTGCCVVLTVILNFSANRMANVIEAVTVIPAQTPNLDETQPDSSLPQQTPAETFLPKEIVPHRIFPANMAPTVPAESSQIARNQFLQQSLFGMILVIMLGGLLTYYLSGKMLKPLKELSEQMKNRTVHNLSESLPVPKTHDELADLTLSFNEMSEKLEQAFTMQKRFSQSAAHELRTPLTVLKTKVDVFHKKQEHTPEEYAKLLAVITTHTNRLADLVKDLLSLTNMDALDCNDTISLKFMIAEIWSELSPLAKEKNISITITGSEELVFGNHSLLHRAFYNLMENAIKYNIDEGAIQVSIHTQEARKIVTISDTGIGIPKQLQKLVFEPFYRVDKSRSRQMGGAGLGLSMVKAIVEKHQGTITVWNALGGGTVFELTLPHVD